MEHTNIASEVEFALHYEKTIHDLTTAFLGFTKSSRTVIPENSQVTSITWKSIVQAAQLGMGAASAETLLADELLASHKVPGVLELEHLESSTCLSPWLPQPIDWRACVRTDLALVACCNINACRSLLETSYSAFRSNIGSASRTVRTKPSNTKGALCFIEDMLSIISVDVNVDPTVLQQMEYCANKLCGVHEILCHPIFPLSSKIFKINKTTWYKVEKALHELNEYFVDKHSDALSNDPETHIPSTTVTALPDQMSVSSGHPFHVVFQKLMKCAAPLRMYLDHETYYITEDDVRSGKLVNGRSPAYLITLLEYAKNLATVMEYTQIGK